MVRRGGDEGWEDGGDFVCRIKARFSSDRGPTEIGHGLTALLLDTSDQPSQTAKEVQELVDGVLLPSSPLPRPTARARRVPVYSKRICELIGALERATTLTDLEVPVLADLATVKRVNPVTAVVACVMTSTFSRAGSVSIIKNVSASETMVVSTRP